MEGNNLEKKIISLLIADLTYESIADIQDQHIKLAILLCHICREEWGDCYPINTFISCLISLLTCKQEGNDLAISFIAAIKLKYEILISHFKKD